MFLLVAKETQVHTIGEDLVLFDTKPMPSIMLGNKYLKQLSENTVNWGINDMA